MSDPADPLQPPPPATTHLHPSSQPQPTQATPSSFPRPDGPARPSSYLRPPPSPSSSSPQPRTHKRGGDGAVDIVDREQQEALRAIRQFLKVRTSYDVLPVSFRLIILDTSLLVNKSLGILVQNAIVSAPLWDSKRSKFAGLLTSTDYINVIQYYWQFPEAMKEIDKFRLDSLRDVEKAIGANPPETVSIHPMKPLYEACRRMLKSRARRIPLVDLDDETKQEMVVSVLTQYRILRFVAVNVKETGMLRKPLCDIGVGTYEGLSTASMDTPVIDVIHTLVRKHISSVPIVDGNGVVLNVYEAVDILTLIKNGTYEELGLTVGKALLKRPADFPGVHTCSEHDRLDTIFDAIRRGRVHRLIVVDGENRLKGMVTLSDILQYLLLEGEGDEEEEEEEEG